MEFRFNVPPGAEEAAAQERALARKQLGEDLKLAVEQLRAAKAAKDAEAVRRLEAKVLPSLMVRIRVYGVDEAGRKQADGLEFQPHSAVPAGSP